MKADLTDRPTKHGLPRVGQINFSNCLPINLPIERGQVTIDADFVEGTPQELNQLFAAGKLDISSTSSFVYVKGGEELTLLPDLSISSTGAVGSVLFFSKHELSQLADRTIYLPAASATSIRLLALMLKMEHGIDVRFKTLDEPNIDDPACDAALIIGDRALQIDDDWSQRSIRIDMGQWWTERFSLPMVFGVFVANKNYVEHFAQNYRHVSESLILAKQLGTTTMLNDVIEKAHEMTGLSDSRMERYFRHELNYDLGESHIESLHLFRRLLGEHDLLKS